MVRRLLIAVILLNGITLMASWGESAPRPTATVEGTASCSNRGCHGEVEPANKTRAGVNSASYTLWLRQDRHAESYRTLQGALAQDICRRLGLRAPIEETRCLACHVNPLVAGETNAALDLKERQSGVGCESCHGAAQRWLRSHAEVENQKTRLADRTKSFISGMKAIQQGHLAERVALCAGCHVGAPADESAGLPLRDMNHDMIAAGHPRLTFEYTSYMANMPKHWVEPALEENHEARAWAIGQTETARSTLRLRADRMSRKEQWPEFAEFDCISCHHDLGRPGQAVSRGRLKWNDWPTALLPLLLTDSERASLDGWTRLTDPRMTAETKMVAASDTGLQRASSRLARGPIDPEAWHKVLRGMKSSLTTSQRDHLEQISMALIALEESRRARTSGE